MMTDSRIRPKIRYHQPADGTTPKDTANTLSANTFNAITVKGCSMIRLPRLTAQLPALLFSVLALAACGGSSSVDLVGTVERRALELAAPTSEIIVEVPKGEGERVEAQDVVVQLDTAVAQADLRAHEAAHAAAEAALVESERELKRQSDLRASRVSTQQAFDAAKRRRDEALAMVAEKEARITQVKKRLEDLTIRAHTSGFVDQLPFEQGERVPAGGVVAVVVADEAPWVRVWVPARVVARTSHGTEADISIEGFQDQYTGKVSHIARESEFTPHYALTERESAHLVFETRITLDDAPAELRPGLPARVRLRLDAAQ